ncbi:MAG: histidine kinase [Verrucomicrobiota bacterium]
MAVGFWLAVAILIGIGVATHQSTVRLLAADGRVERARNITENLQRIRFALQDAEQQARELITTDDMTHQKARLLAAAQVNGAFSRLRKSTSDWLTPGHDIAALEILAGERLRVLDEVVQLRNTQGLGVAIQFLDANQNRTLASQIDASIYALMAAERQALITRDDELKAKAHFSVMLFVLGCFVSLGILSGVFYYLNVQIDARQSAETALAREKLLLEQRVGERTWELLAMNEQLVHEAADRRRAEEGLQVLSGQLLQLQDQERRHIARELHDVTAQNLSAITLNLARVKTLLADADQRTVRVLNDSIQLAEECLREIRTLSYVLHPPMLDEYGLPRALEWYLEGFRKRSDIDVQLTVVPDIGRLPADAETALFRIVQESLTNIRRHSGSHTATIQLTRDDTAITLLIQDSGHGFHEPLAAGKSPSLLNLGVGVTGMRERLRQLGGQLQIESSPTGTTVRAVVPATGKEQ